MSPCPTPPHVKLESPMHPPSRTTFRVRYAETDQMGVVYYANYFVWAEIGRVEFLRQLGFEYKQMELADDRHLPVVEASCRYRAPARYDDQIILETRIVSMRSVVLKFGYRILRDEPDAPDTPRLLAEAETTHVIVDRNMQKCALPDKYAAVLRATIPPTPG
jgi:acyl-CoA thioester hydrolase